MMASAPLDPTDAKPGDAEPSPPPGTPKNPSRRRLLGTAGSAAFGVGAGLAGGGALGYQASPPPPLVDGVKRFKDKVVVITGGTSGIGRASVIAFADAGARVVFCGRRGQLGAQVEAEVRQRGGQARFMRADVRHADQIQALMRSVVEREGRLDIAFNNAGIYANHPFHRMPIEVFDDVQATNMRGAFLCMQAQIPIMLRQGGGVIILTSSVQDLATRVGSAAYSPSKRGQVALARVAALEYGNRGIRVNALCPGATDTEMVRAAGLPPAAWGVASKQWAKANVHGMQRMGTADEMARAAMWIASDEMGYLNGASIVVDGGMTAAL